MMKRALLLAAALYCFAVQVQAQTPAQSHDLAKAVLKKDLPAAEALLTTGTNPNTVIEVVPGFATTYLITAVTNYSLDLARLLLKHKAQVNQPDAFKGTALMTAVSKGNGAMVELLLASGADARAKDDDGKDALALAKESGNAAIVALPEAKLK